MSPEVMVMGKKIEILRFRVDASLFTAVQRCSQQSSLSLSEFLRQSIIHELASQYREASGAAIGADPPGIASQHEGHDRRRLCAEMISSMLLEGQQAHADPEQRRTRGRRVAKLIEIILRLLVNPAEADDQMSSIDAAQADRHPAKLNAPDLASGSVLSRDSVVKLEVVTGRKR
jgi:hypothetical protein